MTTSSDDTSINDEDVAATPVDGIDDITTGSRDAHEQDVLGPIAVVGEFAGVIAAALASPGELVRQGQTLLVVESMKSEFEIVAPASGRVETILVAVGTEVTVGQELALMTVMESDPSEAEIESVPAADALRADVLENRRRHAAGLDSERSAAVERRHARGKRTARENVADLIVDGSFLEYGALVIAAQRRRRPVEELERETPADGIVAGFGMVDPSGSGKTAVHTAVLAYDYTVLAGTQGLQSHKKAERLFTLAKRRSSPLVIFAEGGGGRPGDTDNSAKATGMDLGTFVALGQLNGMVPTVAIASGRCFAGNAALVGVCDLTIATEDANIGMGGPAMIEGGGLGRFDASDIGPAAAQSANGVIDVLVPDEASATAVAKKYLGFFTTPEDAWTAADQRELNQIVPEAGSRVFDVRRLIDVLADTNSVLELRAGFGAGMVTCLARIESKAVGIVANNGAHAGGAIDSAGADKMTRFLNLCDNYRIPVVTLADTPGFMVGPASEETAAVRHFGRIFVTGPNLSVPMCTVIIRKAYGLGGQAMAGGSFRVPDAIVSWPTGALGAMGPEGAVRLGYRRELEAIHDPDEREAEFARLLDEYVREGRAYNAASVFELDDVIEPAATRKWITATIADADPREQRVRRLDAW